MPALEFLHYDVFTNEPFTGNQLAVFRDANSLDGRTMQAIAREMNFSESTFLLPAERADTDLRMRIFTPGVELPMAGHPTIGSTFALAHLGMLKPGQSHVTFGLGVGPTRVELSWTQNHLSFARMDQQLPDVRQPAADGEGVLRAIGLDASARADGLSMQEISCGVPYLLVPLRDRQAVDAAIPDIRALGRLAGSFRGSPPAVYLFAIERNADEIATYGRMFAADLGVVEDPATGSACAPIGCYLVQQGIVRDAAAQRVLCTQGVAMGRPSRIHVAITHGSSGEITRVQVGGEAVLVAEGRFRVA